MSYDRALQVGLVWEVFDCRYRLEPGSAALGRAIDAQWGPSRPHEQQNTHWEWEKIFRSAKDAFCIVEAESGVPVAAWSSCAARPLRFQEGPSYRLDFVEVCPSLRGGDFGTLALYMVLAMANLAGCQLVILQAFPEVADFYRKAGATEGAPQGWKYDKDLIPFIFHKEVLDRAKETIDALVLESPEES